MKKSILFLFLFISSFYASAQNDHNLILIKFKDGAVYLGEKLSEEDDIIGIKLKQRGPAQSEEIVHVDRNSAREVYDNQNAAVFENGKINKTKGLYGNLNLGIGLSAFTTVSLSTSINYWLNNKLTVGIGLGSQGNETAIGGFFVNPQFANFYSRGRYYLTHKKKRVFATGRMGYGLGLPDPFSLEGSTARGGLLAGVGLGVSFASRSTNKWVFEIENYFQKASGLSIQEDPLGNDIRANYDLWFKRLIVKVGMDF